jgi:hypothetical protein
MMPLMFLCIEHRTLRAVFQLPGVKMSYRVVIKTPYGFAVTKDGAVSSCPLD